MSKEKTMANKKFLLGMLAMALTFGMAVVGCDNGSTDNGSTGGGSTYYYEAYTITMAQYNSFNSSVTPGYNYSFSQIKSFRETLKTYGGSFVESNGGVSESELKTFANQHGISGSDYTQAKNSLDSVGNLIFFFQYAPNPSTHVVWMYIEKE